MTKTKTYGIMFHYFHNEIHKPSQGSISAEELEHIINTENVVSAKEWIDDKGICLTFDDGLKAQYDIALPILKKHNLTAFWFVNTAMYEGKNITLELYRSFRNKYYSNINAFYIDFFKEAKIDQKRLPDNYLHEFLFYTEMDRKFRYARDIVLKKEKYDNIMDRMMINKNVDKEKLANSLWMSKDNLQELKKLGHVIGMHSHTHPTNMARLPYNIQQLEYEKNIQILTNILQERPTIMSHPNNSYSSDTLILLHKLGIKIGFRSNLNKQKYSELEFPRKDAIYYRGLK